MSAVLEICARIRNKVAKGFVPASTMHDSHTIGSVPVCRVTASTVQETHTKGSVPVCRVNDKNLEKSVRKGTQSISHAMAFDELSGAEEDGREEANVHREPKEKTESYKQESELLCNFHTRWVEVLEREVLEIWRVWCSVKASTCLEARVLGGFNPQKKRRKSRKQHVAIIHTFARLPLIQQRSTPPMY